MKLLFPLLAAVSLFLGTSQLRAGGGFSVPNPLLVGAQISPSGSKANDAFVRVQFNTLNSFSARIVVGGQEFSYSGEFDGTNSARFTIPRSPRPEVTVTIAFSGGVTFGVNCTIDSGGEQFTFALPEIYEGANTLPVSQQGRKVLFHFSGESPPFGFAAFQGSLDGTGRGTFRGQLADGSRATFTVYALPTGHAIFFANPYGPKAGGILADLPTANSSDPAKRYSGEGLWTVPAGRGVPAVTGQRLIVNWALQPHSSTLDGLPGGDFAASAGRALLYYFNGRNRFVGTIPIRFHPDGKVVGNNGSLSFRGTYQNTNGSLTGRFTRFASGTISPIVKMVFSAIQYNPATDTIGTGLGNFADGTGSNAVFISPRGL